MNYDDWKTQYPPEWDEDEENTCRYCGVPIANDEKYCSIACKKADISIHN